MKLISKSLQIGLVSASLAIAGTTCAKADSHQGPMNGSDMHAQQGQSGGMPMPRLAQKLDLTTAQQQAISQKLTPIGEKMQQAVSQIQSSRSQLQAFMLKGDFTNSKIKGLAKQQGDALAQLTLLRMQSKQAVFSSLTPEQQKAYLRMMKKRHDKMMKMMQQS